MERDSSDFEASCHQLSEVTWEGVMGVVAWSGPGVDASAFPMWAFMGILVLPVSALTHPHIHPYADTVQGQEL